MRLTVVAADTPDPQGTAVGRTLWAWCEGARSLGHDLQVWAWQRSPNSPDRPLPEWCRYEPYAAPPRPMWREHLSSILRPRAGLAGAVWPVPEDRVVVADEASSSPAVEGRARSATILHYRALPDAVANRRLKLAVVQDLRAERRAARKVSVIMALSPRVARHLGREAFFVPAACPIPPGPLPFQEAPVAAIMADWSWPPNRAALALLLSAWPEVRQDVTGARLLVAGRAMPPGSIGTLPGVEFLGPVGDSLEVLSRAAVLPFPCPPSSGPKIKVLEAMACGLPVVTTRHGVEGIVMRPGEGPVVAGRQDFGRALVALLRSPERRAAVGRSGRAVVEAHHAPVPAARRRLAVLVQAFGEDA